MTDLSPAHAADLFLSTLRRPIRLLVAVSGGSDSTGLLLALARAVRKQALHDISLCAATIDHALRAQSAEEALDVAALCARLSIPHVIRRWDGDKPRTGIAAAARAARYRLLAQAAEELQADAIATAHTRDDQDETLTMRAARSDDDTAIGLSGMAPATLYGGTIWILRPFLECRRDAIRTDILAQGEGWIDDPSNLDTHYERVRTRLDLAGRPTTLPSPATAADRRSRLSAAAADLLAAHATLHQQTVMQLPPAALASDPDVLRYALGGLLPVMGGASHRPGRSVMDKVMTFAATGRGRMTAARCLLERRREGLFLARENRAILPLVLQGGETGLWDGRFVVSNHGDGAVSVEIGSREEELDPTLPTAIGRHAAAIRPSFNGNQTLAQQDVDIAVALPHFDGFLSQYDLAFANAVAALVGRQSYPPPPRVSC